MKALINQTHLCYCEICYETIIIKRKWKNTKSRSHKHKRAYGTVVRQYEFTNPDFDKVNYILNNTTEDCLNMIINL